MGEDVSGKIAVQGIHHQMIESLLMLWRGAHLSGIRTTMRKDSNADFSDRSFIGQTYLIFLFLVPVGTIEQKCLADQLDKLTAGHLWYPLRRLMF